MFMCPGKVLITCARLPAPHFGSARTINTPYIYLRAAVWGSALPSECGDAADFEPRERDRSGLGRISTSLGGMSYAQPTSRGLSVLSYDFTGELHPFRRVQGSLIILLVQAPDLVA
jgi:hypothetical protein